MATQSKIPAFNSLYYRISIHWTKMKTVVACGHKLLGIIYKVLSKQVHYAEKALGLRQQSKDLLSILMILNYEYDISPNKERIETLTQPFAPESSGIFG